MELSKEIYKLTEYGIKNNLIEEEDRNYIINKYLGVFGLDEFVLEEVTKKEIQSSEIELAVVLDNLTNIACDRGILETDGITKRDLFDTKLMGIMVERPTEIIRQFRDYYSDNPETATNWFYKFSQDTNYIRRDRIKKTVSGKLHPNTGILILR